MSDCSDRLLRGPVKTCHIHRTWSSCGGSDGCDAQQRHDETTLEFLPNGALESQLHRNFDNSEWSSIYSYTPDARLFTVQSLSGGQLSRLRRHEYDKDRRLTRVVDVINEKESVAETLDYDDAGRTHRVVHFNETGGTDVMYWVDTTNAGYSGTGAVEVSILQNEQNEPTELRFQDREGRVVSRVAFAYDDKGRVIEEVQHAQPLPNLELGPTRRKHSYDEHSNRIETTMWIFGNLGRELTRTEYNVHGDPVAQISESENHTFNYEGTGPLPDQPASTTVTRSEARFHYEYDERGNWTKKIVEGRNSSDGPYRVSTVEERTLTYYE